MDQPKLAPTSNQPNGAVPPSASVGQGAQVVPLQVVLQSIQGTYFDPLKGSGGQERGLPPHRWELHLVGTSGVFFRSTLSDSGGRSQLVKTPELTAAAPGAKWTLSLRPELDDANLATIRGAGEVWVDLETNEWVVLSSFPAFERRKLVRLPLWTSPWKAKSGGFKQALGATFAADGALQTDEITTPATARWDIQVDFGWLRTFVAFNYHDVVKKKTVPLPSGLCLQARGSKRDVRTLQVAPGRVGGGTCIDDKGTLYLLHERTPEGSADVELGFDNSFVEETFVDLAATPPAAGAPDTRLQRDFPKTRDPKVRYVLPNAWCSLGMEARIGTGPRSAWSAMKPTPPNAVKPVSLTTSASAPLVFHLDDTLLVDRVKGAATIAKGARLTIFDHRLTARKPFDAVMVPLWAGSLGGNYCPAEEVIAVSGDDWEASTFVINHEGDFYALREDRVTGTFGTTRCLGARAAVANALQDARGDFTAGYPNLDNQGTAELLLFTDAYPGPYTTAVEGPFLAGATGAKLCHLLVYVPLLVRQDPVNPAASLLPLYQRLVDAADRWDQAHPATGAAGKKDYVAVPEGGVKAGTRVVKLKHFFGHRTDGGHKFTIFAAGKIPPEDRSFVLGKTMTYLMNGATSDPMFGGGLQAGDGDGVTLAWFTLAHELGHTMGLPDEYLEPLDLRKLKLKPGSDPLATPQMGRFSQVHESYPFQNDAHGMMRSAKLPRLRYYWHHLGFLSGRASALLPEGPYVHAYPDFQGPVNTTARGGLTHVMPDGNRRHPWTLRSQKSLTGNLATLALYDVGDDEGTVWKMFRRPPGSKFSPGEWVNGVAIVRSKLWFNFHASATGDFADDAARWDVVRGFNGLLFKGDTLAQQNFCLEGPSAAALPRIAVVFQPLFEYGPAPTAGTLEGTADLVIDVVFQNGPPKTPLVKPSSRPRRQVNQGDVDLSILRMILNVPPVPPATVPSNGPIVAADLADVARRVEEMMGTGVGTYLVKAIQSPQLIDELTDLL